MQVKVSIPDDEWQKVLDYFSKHEKKLVDNGIRNPTALLRHWLREAAKRPYSGSR
jgi:hypothetical protein